MKNFVIISIILLFSCETSFCQQDSLIKVSAKQDLNRLVISIHNKSWSFIVLNKCFEFQTEGEMNKPDLSVLIKESNDKYYTPLAVNYTIINDSCYVKLDKDSVFTYSIDLRYYFREDVLTCPVKAKIRIETILVRNQKVIPRFIMESPEFTILPPTSPDR